MTLGEISLDSSIIQSGEKRTNKINNSAIGEDPVARIGDNYMTDKDFNFMRDYVRVGIYAAVLLDEIRAFWDEHGAVISPETGEDYLMPLYEDLYEFVGDAMETKKQQKERKKRSDRMKKAFNAS